MDFFDIAAMDGPTRHEVIGLELDGVESVPAQPRGVVLFVCVRNNPTDVRIARALNQRRIATVVVNLLTRAEQQLGRGTDVRFDATALGARVIALVDDIATRGPTAGLRGGLFGSGSAAAGAIVAAAARPGWARAVFSCSGRPDLAGELVRLVRCPTLLVVGEVDAAVRAVNEQAGPQFPRTARVVRVPGASLLHGDPPTLVSELARDWFTLRLGGRARWPATP
jgi:putative phosphoribosyl transferase